MVLLRRTTQSPAELICTVLPCKAGQRVSAHSMDARGQTPVDERSIILLLLGEVLLGINERPVTYFH